MAGTKTAAEALQSFLVSTLLTSASTRQNSLEGINPRMLTNRAICWVEDQNALYRWDDSSLDTANGDTIVIPQGQAAGVAGRWFFVEAFTANGELSPFFYTWLASGGDTTTIAGSDTPTPLEGTFIQGAGVDPDFSLDTATGIVTYNGNLNITALFQIQGTLDVAGAGTQDVLLFVDRNDSTTGSTPGSQLIPASRAVSGRLRFGFYQTLTVANTNTFQMKVINRSDGSDISLLSGAIQPQVLIRRL